MKCLGVLVADGRCPPWEWSSSGKMLDAGARRMTRGDTRRMTRMFGQSAHMRAFTPLLEHSGKRVVQPELTRKTPAQIAQSVSPNNKGLPKNAQK